ncbi:HPr family phosphocarrier protein [Psychrobacillus psychrodurans]|uniref:HPr family phosphocarrier protein n=1 Tax=Psychrobacillus TaxID=1221880 RepID=UPI0008E4B318|nr:HPr family phosphocarrier protein [Psychrobacillus psychrodurans]MCK1996916.1 HPr family phosphocarrier protein [Psychrobacillus psychrodurans]MCZ8538757.1 HPr family phosphocarrier protein [Psychrobacillus psychrodurans]SFM21286.1 phosphocarrier protein [Psychrobacillus psychrodurans]
MEKTFKITTPEGLHARPSTLLVSAATAFSSNVLLSYNDKSVNLKSIMGVMAQGIAPGSVVTISAEGMDEEETIIKLTETMISNGIGVEI